MKNAHMYPKGILFAVALSGLLGACGDDGDDNTTGPGTSVTAGGTGAASTGDATTGSSSSTGDGESGSSDGETGTEPTTGGSTSDGSTGGEASDPNYPRPDGQTCPEGFVFQSVAGGGSYCTQTCPNDGADTCMMGATGTAPPWCSFPSNDASNQDCSMDAESCPDGETCIEFAGDVAICRDEESRCGLQCANGETCPDGMECDNEMAGGFCVYR